MFCLWCLPSYIVQHGPKTNKKLKGKAQRRENLPDHYIYNFVQSSRVVIPLKFSYFSICDACYSLGVAIAQMDAQPSLFLSIVALTVFIPFLRTPNLIRIFNGRVPEKRNSHISVPRLVRPGPSLHSLGIVGPCAWKNDPRSTSKLVNFGRSFGRLVMK